MTVRFLTADEAAAETGLPVDWLYRQARRGKIPHHRLGRKVRFTESDLVQLVQDTQVVPTGSELRPIRRVPRGDTGRV